MISRKIDNKKFVILEENQLVCKAWANMFTPLILNDIKSFSTEWLRGPELVYVIQLFLTQNR